MNYIYYIYIYYLLSLSEYNGMITSSRDRFDSWKTNIIYIYILFLLLYMYFYIINNFIFYFIYLLLIDIAFLHWKSPRPNCPAIPSPL